VTGEELLQHERQKLLDGSLMRWCTGYSRLLSLTTRGMDQRWLAKGGAGFMLHRGLLFGGAEAMQE